MIVKFYGYSNLKLYFYLVFVVVNYFRLLMCNRRNFPVALTRESWRRRDTGFTDKGVMIRCVQDDQVHVKIMTMIL